MLRRATSYDVAAMAGVAQSTVSRCFRADSTISPATRQRVVDAARQLGYRPNALARSLITRRSDLVGLILARYTLHGNPDVMHALAAALAGAGKQLLLVAVESDYPSLDALRGLLEYPLDGLISCVLLAPSDLAELRRRRLPIVFYNRDPDGDPADSVTADHYYAASNIATALLGAGHRRFLCIGGPATAYVSRQRSEGFLRALAGRGIAGTPLLETDFSYAQASAAFLGHMTPGARPDAVFCANDQLAMAVIDACHYRLGWKIPDDLSVVGFDDVTEAARPSYDLTTLHQDAIEMARLAVRILLLRLANADAPPIKAQVPATLIRRGSARLAEIDPARRGAPR